jgi:hypothetical protein
MFWGLLQVFARPLCAFWAASLAPRQAGFSVLRVVLRLLMADFTLLCAVRSSRCRSRRLRSPLAVGYPVGRGVTAAWAFAPSRCFLRSLFPCGPISVVSMRPCASVRRSLRAPFSRAAWFSRCASGAFRLLARSATADVRAQRNALWTDCFAGFFWRSPKPFLRRSAQTATPLRWRNHGCGLAQPGLELTMAHALDFSRRSATGSRARRERPTALSAGSSLPIPHGAARRSFRYSAA